MSNKNNRINIEKARDYLKNNKVAVECSNVQEEQKIKRLKQ